MNNWLDDVPQVQDNVRAERKVPMLNFSSHLTSKELLDQLSQPHKDAKKELMKFKTKEEEIEYAEETNALVHSQIKQKLIEALICVEAEANLHKLRHNVEVSQERFCVDTLDKLKRKVLFADVTLENKRVLLCVNLYLANNSAYANPGYTPKDDYSDSGFEFASVLENAGVGAFFKASTGTADIFEIRSKKQDGETNDVCITKLAHVTEVEQKKSSNARNPQIAHMPKTNMPVEQRTADNITAVTI